MSEVEVSTNPTQVDLSTNAFRARQSAEKRRAKSIPEFAEDWGISTSMTWKLIKLGRLRAVKVGARTLILDEDEERYARPLPQVGVAA